ncbi:MAG: S9 family peptidase [Bacteroidota bacterium]|nr:S9 family peptidase [Bacteroidota bacterium]
MLRSAFLFLFVFLAVSSLTAERKNSQPERIGAETFFKTSRQSNYKISPDAKYLAYFDTVNGHSNIFVKKIGQQDFIQLTNDPVGINSFIWGNSDFILYKQDNNGDENYRIYRLNIYTKEIKCLTEGEKIRCDILGPYAQSKDAVIITANMRNPRLLEPYSLNFLTGEMKLLCENPGGLRGWVADNAGIIRIAQAGKLLYRKDEKSEFREILTIGSDEIFDPRFFNKDNNHVFAYSNIGRDRIAIVEFDLDKGKEVRTLFENPEYDAFGDDERDQFTYSLRKQELLYARYTTEKRHLFFFDKQLEKIYSKLKKKLGRSYEIDFASYSDDLSRFVIRLSSDRLQGKNYYYDNKSGSLELLGSESPWLIEDKMAEMMPVSYKSRDGLTIHGYLTLPKGADPKGLPVIVHPHAGPQWRNSWIFDKTTQFFANHGYAVFEMNFRGSTGYGRKFMKAGFKQWGLKMQDDITDGVKWLIQKGIADPKRIAIFGWSFGGYAALAGITFTPDLYACGVDFWGISNYFSLYRSFPPYWPKDRINERWGDIVKDSLQMYNTSPVFHARNIKVPVLILQGENDVRVKIGQSEEMAETLKKLNKEVEYVLMEGEGHGIKDEQKIILQMNRVDNFLEKNLRPKKQL